MPARAQADIVTFELNCQILGGPTCSSTSSLGTITLDDGGGTGTVTGTIDLAGDGVLKDSAYLNLTTSFTDLDVTGSKLVDFNYDVNNIKADGYSGDFDLEILFDNSTFEPYTFTVTATGLTANSFFTTETNGLLYAAAHIQGGEPAGCSIWMGSTGDNPNTGGTTPPCGPGGEDGPAEGPGGEDGPAEGPLPEPASLLLFGMGLLAAGARMRGHRA